MVNPFKRLFTMAQIDTGWLLINPCKKGHLYFADKGTFLLCLDKRQF